MYNLMLIRVRSIITVAEGNTADTAYDVNNLNMRKKI